MRLALFRSSSIYAAWSVSEGITDNLRRMGHEVTDCPIDPGARTVSRSAFPAMEDYSAFIVSGPEHLGRHFRALYPGHVVPTLAWMHESVEREDYGKLDVEAIKTVADVIFTPAPQDEKYGFKYLPNGVDTGMFWPFPECVGESAERDIELATMGLIYPKRKAFLEQLPQEIRAKLRFGRCQVEDMDGVNVRKSAELYAANLRRIKVFLNLPSLSRMLTCKVFEAMACGCAVLTEFIDERTCGEVEQCAFYRSPKDIREECKFSPDDSAATVREVHDKHRLELRLAKMLEAL